jgi:hypothetical protein
MFCDVIGTKARAIVLFDELEPRLEQVGQRRAVVVDMIENAELQSHGVLPPDMFLLSQSYPRGRPLPSIRRSRARPSGVRPSVKAAGGNMFGWIDLRFLLAVFRTGCALAARAPRSSEIKTARRSDARERRLISFAGLAVACLLPACATTSMPSVAPGENEGISGYVACLDAAARRIDDGRSDVASVAAAIKGMCAARFPEPAKAPGATMSAAARQKSEARQMELSTMVVQDLRGQP